MRKRRWIMIPAITVGTILFAMSICSAEENFLKKGV
jgi:hypothetical protein